MATMRVALALGSGGARGYAHIGVINELRDRGSRDRRYRGVFDGFPGRRSAGGGQARRIRRLGKLFDATGRSSPARPVAHARRGCCGQRRSSTRSAKSSVRSSIEELPIPYTSVSTDLISGKSVWLQRGPVDEAIRASIAIPGVITPHELDGRLLADGGILDPLPMAPIAAVNADVTIAVSLNGDDPPRADQREPRPERRAAEPDVAQHDGTARHDRGAHACSTPPPRGRCSAGSTARRTTARTRDADAIRDADPMPVPKLGGFEVMNRTIDIAQAALMRHTLAALPARSPDRGAAHHVPQPRVLSRRRGHRHRTGTRRHRPRRLLRAPD